jgi:hypothetical protein
MGATTMVVLIVVFSVGFSVLGSMYSKHIKFKEKMLQHNQANNEHSNELKQHIANLNERVETLEKIVTYEGYQVAKEINQL